MKSSSDWVAPVPVLDPASVEIVQILDATLALHRTIQRTGPGMPTAALFHPAVVYLLAQRAGWKAYVGVPAKDIYDDALRLVGIDPKTTTLPLEGRNGLYRRVGWAVRNQCRAHCGASPALTLIQEKSCWSVTALGLVEAKRLKDQFEGQITSSAEPNLTAQWVESNYKALYERLHSYLGRKMLRSASFSKVDDHIQTFFTNLINRDGLRDRIQEGQSIPYSQVCAWARRSAYSEIRDEGTEPVCRIFHGSLTKKEVGSFDPSNWTTETTPITINQSEFLRVNTYAEHSESDEGTDTMEFLADPQNMESQFLDMDTFNKALKAVGAALHAEIPEGKDPGFHEQLLYERFVEGLTVNEIAAKHHMDHNQATVALGRIRKAVTRHRVELDAEFASHS